MLPFINFKTNAIHHSKFLIDHFKNVLDWYDLMFNSLIFFSQKAIWEDNHIAERQ